MQSRFFQSVDIDDEELIRLVGRAVETIRNIDAPIWQRLVADIPQFLRHRVRARRDEFVEEQLRFLKVGRDIASPIVSLAQVLVNAQLNPLTKDEHASDVVDDLLELAGEVGPDVDRSRLEAFVKYTWAQIEPIKLARDQAKLTSGVLPSFESIATTVELRAMFDASFDPQTSLEQYRPKLVGQIPIASIRLRTDEEEVYAFQCDRTDLELLINNLRATLIELDVLSGGSS